MTRALRAPLFLLLLLPLRLPAGAAVSDNRSPTTSSALHSTPAPGHPTTPGHPRGLSLTTTTSGTSSPTSSASHSTSSPGHPTTPGHPRNSSPTATTSVTSSPSATTSGTSSPTTSSASHSTTTPGRPGGSSPTATTSGTSSPTTSSASHSTTTPGRPGGSSPTATTSGTSSPTTSSASHSTMTPGRPGGSSPTVTTSGTSSPTTSSASHSTTTSGRPGGSSPTATTSGTSSPTTSSASHSTMTPGRPGGSSPTVTTSGTSSPTTSSASHSTMTSGRPGGSSPTATGVPPSSARTAPRTSHQSAEPTTSSNRSTSPPLSVGIAFFLLSFSIQNRQFNSSLEDPRSGYYQQLQRDISELFLQIYEKESFLGLSTITFSPGSVVVESTLAFRKGATDARRVQTQLEENEKEFARYNLSISSVRAQDASFPASGPAASGVPGWGVALLALVCVLVALALIYVVALTVCQCRRENCGELDIFPTRDAYHPMSEYPTYQTRGRYVPPGSRRSPYEEVSAGNGGSGLSYVNPNTAATSANL